MLVEQKGGHYSQSLMKDENADMGPHQAMARNFDFILKVLGVIDNFKVSEVTCFLKVTYSFCVDNGLNRQEQGQETKKVGILGQ